MASPRSKDDSGDDAEKVVRITGDDKSRRRFKQLHEIAKKEGCLSDWDTALMALERRLGGSDGIARPGAYFCAVLVSLLNSKGVAVPVGTVAERTEVRGMISKSLGMADELLADG